MDEISDITGDSVDLIIKGFDLAVGFSGVVVVSQYDGDKMLSAETIDASATSVALGDEIEENIKLKDEADKIRIMYINTATYGPIIGQYEIK